MSLGFDFDFFLDFFFFDFERDWTSNPSFASRILLLSVLVVISCFIVFVFGTPDFGLSLSNEFGLPPEKCFAWLVSVGEGLSLVCRITFRMPLLSTTCSVILPVRVGPRGWKGGLGDMERDMALVDCVVCELFEVFLKGVADGRLPDDNRSSPVPTALFAVSTILEESSRENGVGRSSTVP